MSDYKVGTQQVQGGPVATPTIRVRQDRPVDTTIAGGNGLGNNNAFGISSLDGGGAMRIVQDSGVGSYRATMNFSSDSSGTDIVNFKGNGTIAQWTITCSYTPTGGTFTITLSDAFSQTQTTAPIAYNATAAQVQAAIEAVVGPYVFCTGGALPGTAIVVNFVGALAGPYPVTYNGNTGAVMSCASSLTGGTPGTISAATTTTGILGNTQRIKRIIVTTMATAAADGLVSIIRRKTQGTATLVQSNLSLAQPDQSDAASNATIGYYTTHPSALGTAVGTLAVAHLTQGALGTPPTTQLTFDFTQPTSKPVYVRGALDFIAVNIAAALGGSGNVYTVEIDYDELPGTA